MSGLHALPAAPLSRRGLLGGLGVAVGAVALGGGASALAAAGRAVDPLRRSAWTPLVGRTLDVRIGTALRRARLVAVDDLGLEGSEVRARAGGRDDAFALAFALPGRHVPAEPVLVRHPTHGTIPLLLTPGRRRSVATIDRRLAA